MVKAKVRISIVTYNSEKVFIALDNLLEEFQGDPSVVISVYDNHSDSQFVDRLKEYQDRVEILFSDENKGFGHGHNENLLHAKEEFFLIFNPDILLKKEVLTHMVEALAAEPVATMMVPKILNVDGSTQYLIRKRYTIFDLLIRRFPIKKVRKWFAERIDDYECKNLPDNQNSYITIGSGCFILIQSSTFKAIGGFDNRFFMYLEDYDLCMRVNEVSKIVYMPKAEVVHFWERGSGKNLKLAWIHLKSLFKFFNKWGWRFF